MEMRRVCIILQVIVAAAPDPEKSVSVGNQSAALQNRVQGYSSDYFGELSRLMRNRSRTRNVRRKSFEVGPEEGGSKSQKDRGGKDADRERPGYVSCRGERRTRGSSGIR